MDYQLYRDGKISLKMLCYRSAWIIAETILTYPLVSFSAGLGWSLGTAFATTITYFKGYTMLFGWVGGIVGAILGGIVCYYAISTIKASMYNEDKYFEEF